MGRLARVVVCGLLHQVTQRGNGRAKVFFGGDDTARYRDILGQHCREPGVEVWAGFSCPTTCL